MLQQRAKRGRIKNDIPLRTENSADSNFKSHEDLRTFLFYDTGVLMNALGQPMKPACMMKGKWVCRRLKVGVG